MVQIPKFTNKNLSQRTSGVPFNIPNVSEGATLPFRALSNEANKLTNIATNVKKQKIDQKIAIDKLNTQNEIKQYQLDEKYKTDVFKLNETLDSDFKKAQLTLNRKTEVKSIYHSILPEINQLKMDIASDPDTKNSANNWEQTSKKIYNKAIKNVDDQVVKELFTMKYNDLIAAEGIEVSSSIRKTDIQNAIGIHQIEKEQLYNDYLNYEPGHPKREAAWERLFGVDDENPNIFIEAAGDLILNDLPHIAIIKAQKELYTMEAQQMVDKNPHKFLELLKSDYWKTRLDPTTITSLIDPATDNARRMDIDTLVSFMPVVPNQTLEEADEIYKEAKTGNFYDNEELQSIYENLDTQGKADFNTAINAQRANVRAEIGFKQSQEVKLELDANNDLYVKTFDQIILGDLSISDIDNIEFQGKMGTQYKSLLKDLIVKREQNLLPSDQNLKLHDQIFQKIMKGEIQSLTDQVIPHDGKMKSILELTGGEDGLGTNQTKDFYSLIANKNNANVLQNARYFEEFVAANKDNILGNAAFAKLNLKAEPRFFQFKLIMKQRFEEGIKEGKNVFELLDRGSKDYILKDIVNYIPSKETQMNEVKDSMTFKEDLDTENLPPQKKPNQSIAEWLNSDEYKAWENSQ